MLLERARVRVAEPCGRQTLLSLYCSAVFWGRAMGWSLTRDTLWRAGVDEMLAMVSGRAGHRESTTAVRMRGVEALLSLGRVTLR